MDSELLVESALRSVQVVQIGLMRFRIGDEALLGDDPSEDPLVVLDLSKTTSDACEELQFLDVVDNVGVHGAGRALVLGYGVHG